MYTRHINSNLSLEDAFPIALESDWRLSAVGDARQHPEFLDPIPVDEAEEMIRNGTVTSEAGIVGAIPVLNVLEARHMAFGTITLELTEEVDKRHDLEYRRTLALDAMPKNWRASMEAMDWAVEKLAELGFQIPRTLTLDNIDRCTPVGSPSKFTTHAQTTTMVGVPPVTRYFVVEATHYNSMSTKVFPAWESGYSTVEEAVAYLPEGGVEERSPTLGSFGAKTYEIVGVTRRADGSPLAERTLVPSTGVTAYEVWLRTLIRPRSVTSQRGWLFYTDESSINNGRRSLITKEGHGLMTK